MERRLPEGWIYKKLGDIAEYINGRAFKPTEWSNEGLPIIRIQNLTDKYASFNYFNGDFDEKNFVRENDILISWSASLGVFVWDRGNAYLNQHIFKVILDESLVDRNYFVFAAKSVILDMEKKTHGATMKHIIKSDFNDIQIPLPPLETQRRIVAILDKAEETRRLRAQADELTGKLLQSVFLYMFGDPMRNPKGWKKEALDDVCSEIYRYPTFYGFEYVPEGVPVLKISNMTSDGIFPDDLSSYDKIPDEINIKFPRTIVDEGDIVMEARGTYIGKCSLVPRILAGANISPNTIRIAPNRDLVLPDFLLYLSFTDAWKSEIDKRVRYWKAGFGTIKSTELKSVRIPIPPIQLQNHFLAMVEKCRFLLKDQRHSNQELSNLFSYLQQKAFTGELAS